MYGNHSVPGDLSRLSGVDCTYFLLTIFSVLVDGGWGSWGEWGACSAFCGTSDRFRYRQCDTPLPLYGGEECGSDEYESDTCNGPPCVGKE